MDDTDEIQIHFKDNDDKSENLIFLVVDFHKEKGHWTDIRFVVKIFIDNKLSWFYFTNQSKLYGNLKEYILEVL